MSNNIPNLNDFSDVSELCGVSTAFLAGFKSLSKVKGLDNSSYYRKFFIQKRNGHQRMLMTPYPTLKIAQNEIKNKILDEIVIHENAKAYRKGISIKDNVKYHRGQKFVLKLDIEDFFGHITNKRVFLLFRAQGYKPYIASILANICSLTGTAIPQGAPTSPGISNAIMYTFDETLAKFAKERKLRYTRYADDITFSGDFELVSKKQIIAIVNKNLVDRGFKLNYEKIRVLKSTDSQVITGITTNKTINVNKTYRRNLRLELHHYLSDHSEIHLRNLFGEKYSEYEHLIYVESLLGKINYVLYINDKNKVFFEKQKEKLLAIKKDLSEKY